MSDDKLDPTVQEGSATSTYLSTLHHPLKRSHRSVAFPCPRLAVDQQRFRCTAAQNLRKHRVLDRACLI